MAKPKGLKRHRTSHRQKLQWLREHPEMRELNPWDAARIMIEAGLYSRNTRPVDINVIGLLREAGVWQRK
jgi:hypothetical protein